MVSDRRVQIPHASVDTKMLAGASCYCSACLLPSDSEGKRLLRTSVSTVSFPPCFLSRQNQRAHSQRIYATLRQESCGSGKL